jgi:hypothetical protein
MVSVPTATIPSRSRGSNSGSIAYHLSLSAKIVGWFRSVERRNVRGFGSSSAMSRRLWGSSPRKGGARNSRLLDRLRPVRVDKFTALKRSNRLLGRLRRGAGAGFGLCRCSSHHAYDALPRLQKGMLGLRNGMRANVFTQGSKPRHRAIATQVRLKQANGFPYDLRQPDQRDGWWSGYYRRSIAARGRRHGFRCHAG